VYELLPPSYTRLLETLVSANSLDISQKKRIGTIVSNKQDILKEGDKMTSENTRLGVLIALTMLISGCSEGIGALNEELPKYSTEGLVPTEDVHYEIVEKLGPSYCAEPYFTYNEVHDFHEQDCRNLVYDDVGIGSFGYAIQIYPGYESMLSYHAEGCAENSTDEEYLGGIVLYGDNWKFEITGYTGSAGVDPEVFQEMLGGLIVTKQQFCQLE
jgi:hypothetical protein